MHVLNSRVVTKWGFPDGSAVKNPPANTGDTGSVPESGRSPGEGNGHPSQYSCLGNPMGLWSRKESDMTFQLSMHIGVKIF